MKLSQKNDSNDLTQIDCTYKSSIQASLEVAMAYNKGKEASKDESPHTKTFQYFTLLPSFKKKNTHSNLKITHFHGDSF